MSDTITDRVTALYDRFPYPRPDADGRLDRRLGTGFTLTGDARWILVVGCGTREAALVARDNPRHHIVGIDLSQASLDICRRLCERESISNVSLIRSDFLGDFLTMDHPIFAAVWASGVLHHVPDATGFVRRAFDALEPGGTFLGMVYDAEDKGREAIERLRVLWTDLPCDERGVDAVRARLLALPEWHPARQWYTRWSNHPTEIADTWLHPYSRPYTLDGLISLLERAGFRALAPGLPMVLPTPMAMAQLTFVACKPLS